MQEGSRYNGHQVKDSNAKVLEISDTPQSSFSSTVEVLVSELHAKILELYSGVDSKFRKLYGDMPDSTVRSENCGTKTDPGAMSRVNTMVCDMNSMLDEIFSMVGTF